MNDDKTDPRLSPATEPDDAYRAVPDSNPDNEEETAPPVENPEQEEEPVPEEEGKYIDDPDWEPLPFVVEEPSEEEEEPEFEEEPDRSIYGWLALFLWGGVGLGSLMTVISTFKDLADFNGYFVSSHGTFLFGGVMAALVIAALGIFTIVAFYNRRPDAVAAAKVFTGLVALDGLITLVLAVTHNMTDLLPDAFREIGWGAVWFCFLLASKRVEAVIPEEERRPGIIPPVLGIAGFLAYVLLYFGLQNIYSYYGSRRNIDRDPAYLETGVGYNNPYSYSDEEIRYEDPDPEAEETAEPDYETLIEDEIAGTMLPQKVDEYLTLDNIYLSGKNLVIGFNVAARKDDVDAEPFVSEMRDKTIQRYRDNEIDPIENYMVEGGYNLRYVWKDIEGKQLGKFTISNSELKSAMKKGKG